MKFSDELNVLIYKVLGGRLRVKGMLQISVFQEI